MKHSLKRNECTRQCRYNFTSDERLERGRNLADVYQELDTTNGDLERIKKDFKARIEAHEARIATLAEQVRSGYELRETVCFWEFNKPVEGKKQLRRSDNMEIIETTDMTEADKQLIIDIVETAAAAANATTGHPNAAMAITEKSDLSTEPGNPTEPKGPPAKKDNTQRRRASPGVVDVEADGGSHGEDEDDRNKM